MFSVQPKGILVSVIDLFKPMFTATHSWGNQCQGCTCGCHLEGFAALRLRQKGLYGLVVPMGGNSFQSIAFFGHETFVSARSGNPVKVVSKACFPTCSHSIEAGPCRSRTFGIPHPIHVDLCLCYVCNGERRFGGSPTNTIPKIGEPVESFASRKKTVG